jgi:hypothetical protein
VSTLGLTMAAVFGPVFMGLGFYLLIDKFRTGELYRQKKVTYAAFGAGILAVIGVLIIAAN